LRTAIEIADDTEFGLSGAELSRLSVFITRHFLGFHDFTSNMLVA